MNSAAWAEFGEVRFDVEDRRAVEGVEALDGEGEAVDFEQATAGVAEAVGAGFGALGHRCTDGHR